MAKNFYTRLASKYLKALESGKHFDLLLYAGSGEGKKEFKAHTQIVCIQSTFFETTLSNNLFQRKDNHFVHEEPDVDADVFEVILRYLYTGEVDITKYDGDKILKILIASDKLGIDDLPELAKTYLIEERPSYVREHAATVFQAVRYLRSFDELKNLCLEGITTDLFTNDSYLTLGEDVLVPILERDDFYIKEVVLWKHVLKWVLTKHPELDKDPSKWTPANIKQAQATLQALVGTIRFFLMSSDDYYNEVRPYKKILPRGVNEQVMLYLLTGKGSESFMARPRVKPPSESSA